MGLFRKSTNRKAHKKMVNGREIAVPASRTHVWANDGADASERAETTEALRSGLSQLDQTDLSGVNDDWGKTLNSRTGLPEPTPEEKNYFDKKFGDFAQKAYKHEKQHRLAVGNTEPIVPNLTNVLERESAFNSLREGLTTFGENKPNFADEDYSISQSFAAYQQMMPENLRGKYQDLTDSFSTIGDLAFTLSNGNSSAADVESFYTVKANVKSRMEEFLKEDSLRASFRNTVEDVLADPDKFIVPERADIAYVAANGFTDAVRQNPTSERWESALVIADKIAQSDGDIGMSMAANLFRMKNEVPSLKDAKTPLQATFIQKYTEILKDAGITTKPNVEILDRQDGTIELPDHERKTKSGKSIKVQGHRRLKPN